MDRPPQSTALDFEGGKALIILKVNDLTWTACRFNAVRNSATTSGDSELSAAARRAQSWRISFSIGSITTPKPRSTAKHSKENYERTIQGRLYGQTGVSTTSQFKLVFVSFPNRLAVAVDYWLVKNPGYTQNPPKRRTDGASLCNRPVLVN